MAKKREQNSGIRVAVAGAAGRMGREVVKAVSGESDLKLVAAVDRQGAGEDAGIIAGIEKLGISIQPSLNGVLQSGKPDVLVDFTRHESALANIEQSLEHKVPCVVGTTGFTGRDLAEIKKWSRDSQTPILIAPNFAVGAVLLMKFAQEASKYFKSSEIIELHHDKKLDAPSGTALRTAELMLQSRPGCFQEGVNERILVKGSRGGNVRGIRIHSVRLPGLVAHEEVLFGGKGETLTLRHDSLSRESFMPGVILAIRRIRGLQGLTVGLENILP